MKQKFFIHILFSSKLSKLKKYEKENKILLKRFKIIIKTRKFISFKILILNEILIIFYQILTNSSPLPDKIRPFSIFDNVKILLL